MAIAPATSTPPRKTSARRATTSTPSRTSILIAEALFGDKPIKRRNSNDQAAAADKPSTGILADLQRAQTKAATAKARKPLVLDLGKPQGQHDTATVRDRVRRWQAQGGGVVEQRDPNVFPPEATPVVSEADTDRERDENGEFFEFKGPMKTRTRKDAKIRAREEAKLKQQEEEEARLKKQEEQQEAEAAAVQRRADARAAREEERNKKAAEVAAAAAATKRRKVEKEREARSSSPKKRVLSDGHWRNRQTMPGGDGRSGMGKKKYGSQSPPPPDRSAPATSLADDDGIRVTPLREDSATRRKRRRREAEERARAEQDEVPDTPSRRSSGDRQGTLELNTPAQKSYEQDGIRVFSTPSQDFRHSQSRRTVRSDRSFSDEKQSRMGDDRHSADRTPSTRYSKSRGSQASTTRKWSPTSAAALNARNSEEIKAKKRLVSMSKSNEKPEANRRFSPRGLSKVNILREVYDEGKKIFAKAPEPQHRPASGNRIEAWLNNTTDPFLDDPPASIIDMPPSVPASVVPDDLRSNVPTESASEERAPYPDLSKSEDRDRKSRSWRGSDRRRTSRQTSATQEAQSPHDNPKSPSPLPAALPTADTHMASPDLASQAPSLTPPSLKRAGAKRSSPTRARRKSSPLKESFSETVLETDSIVDESMDFPARDLRPPGLFAHRPFPQTGAHRLSTIASVETFRTQTQPPSAVSEISQDTIREPKDRNALQDKQFDSQSSLPLGKKTSLKRRLTTHADLISVLSLPKTGNQSIMSARSIRTNRSKLESATIDDLLKELSTDEVKYMRELRTLVDGVIPVLLTCVLSKSDSAVAAGLFSRSCSGSEDPQVTRPIIAMGVALERLKSLHKRIPLNDHERLLSWAQGAQKCYLDYLNAWRMGFQDVVVNLAPATESDGETPITSRGGAPPDQQSLYNGLPRNSAGDVVNGDGERVDVAFLLKRPLVRLKYLSKTFKGINFIKPSFTAEDMTAKYESLVETARTRSNEERARLEDEAAANIDPTRAREPRTLAPLPDVVINRSLCVRARDYFNLEMQHSSGQRVDCRVELLLRDENSSPGAGGDLLICEVDGSGRWLLLPPIKTWQVSARNGDRKGEIIVMIRGVNSQGQEWHELLSLVTDDEQAGFEWVQMLGLIPIPPTIERSLSFIKTRTTRPQSALITASPHVNVDGNSRSPSPTEVEVPLGEKARPDSPPAESQSFAKEATHLASVYGEIYATQGNLSRDSHGRNSSARGLADEADRVASQDEQGSPGARSLNDAMKQAGSPSPLRRQRARKYSRAADGSPTSPKSSRLSQYLEEQSRSHSSPTAQLSQLSDPTTSREDSSRRSQRHDELVDFSRSQPQVSRAQGRPQSELFAFTNVPGLSSAPSSPEASRRIASAPSMDLPILPKTRRLSKPAPPDLSVAEEMGFRSPDASSPKRTPDRYKKLQKRQSEGMAQNRELPPSPPPHSPHAVQLKDGKLPSLPPTSSPKQSTPKHRRSSSPLKHEYEPSTASDSSVSEDSATDEEGSTISDATTDEELEDGDAPTPLLPVGALQKAGKISPQGSIYSLPNATLSPSQSASQAPFRTVPQQPHKASRTIASIFSWSDKGLWESLHPDECSVVITPGLIEAYEMSADHSRPYTASSQESDYDSFAGQRPLVALELTPLVPLRRGTALDISIRSPPTERSKITSGSNIMFRSRSTEECEALYAMINTSRINNPTYIALQNARAHTETMSRFNRHAPLSSSTRHHSGSRWGWGGSRSSYRASSSAPRGPSSVAISESSVGSLTSAFSALRRFGASSSSAGGPSRLFNISKSTISSRQSSAAGGPRAGGPGASSATTSLYSSSSGSSTPLPPLPEGMKASPSIGLSNAKIRLYHREGANRWRDMGAARLTITLPPPTSNIPAQTSSGGSGPSSPTTTPPPPPTTSVNTTHAGGTPDNQKRILVMGKSKGECLLDVCLGESCFERIARTGIAISVWEEVVGPNGEVGQVPKEGGVGGGRRGVFMIQMKSEAETAYTFSLVGKLRY